MLYDLARISQFSERSRNLPRIPQKASLTSTFTKVNLSRILIQLGTLLDIKYKFHYEQSSAFSYASGCHASYSVIRIELLIFQHDFHHIPLLSILSHRLSYCIYLDASLFSHLLPLFHSSLLHSQSSSLVPHLVRSQSPLCHPKSHLQSSFDPYSSFEISYVVFF